MHSTWGEVNFQIYHSYNGQIIDSCLHFIQGLGFSWSMCLAFICHLKPVQLGCLICTSYLRFSLPTEVAFDKRSTSYPHSYYQRINSNSKEESATSIINTLFHVMGIFLHFFWFDVTNFYYFSGQKIKKTR